MKTQRFVLIALAAIACNDADVGTPGAFATRGTAEQVPGVDVDVEPASDSTDEQGSYALSVQQGSGSVTSGALATLNLSFPDPAKGKGELSFQVEHGSSKVSLVLRAPYEVVRSRSFVAELVEGPLAEDTASANLFVNGEAVSGELVISISADGRLSGSVTGKGIEFFGKYGLSCAVPPLSLRSEIEAPVPADGPASLFDDWEFRSPECAQAKQALL